MFDFNEPYYNGQLGTGGNGGKLIVGHVDGPFKGLGVRGAKRWCFAIGAIEQAPEARIFREVVASCAVNHFRKADIPVPTAFATATHLSRFYADQIGETETAFKNWEAAVRLQISLATKLRITPQSRYDPKTIARNEPSDGPAPWEPTVASD